MTEAEKLYRKTKQKRVYLNLKNEDYSRWCVYAALKKLPVSTMIRKAVETEISEMEEAYESTVEDILEYQKELKESVNERCM